ncbi:MAG: sigma-70 family RNA polymerase sigma factor [Elusimicrobiota bacterium]
MIKNKTWKWGRRDTKLSDKRWKLVQENMHLVNTVIRYFKKKFPIIQNDLDKYEEAATWGLIHAARKYDFERKEAEFSTYALTAMRRDVAHAIKLNYRYNNRFKSRDAYQEILNDQGIDCSQDNLVSEKRDILEDVICREEINLIREIISQAPDKEKKVIRMRFFEDKTYAEIGEEFGVTREMARIYCNQALEYFTKEIKKANKVEL